MATPNKKLDVPDIGNLLGKISEKRESGELPKSPIQSVQPVAELPEKSFNSKTSKSKNSQYVDESLRRPVGRRSLKRPDVEYVKISPNIPKPLKRRVDMAIAAEDFKDREGNIVNTLDELVALALERLLA